MPGGPILVGFLLVPHVLSEGVGMLGLRRIAGLPYVRASIRGEEVTVAAFAVSCPQVNKSDACVACTPGP